MYLLGYDIGSSSIKVAIVDAELNNTVDVIQYPETPFDIVARKSGWAEQHPEVWWQSLCFATKKIFQKNNIHPTDVKGIGISYQMHGLVLIDKNQQILRPAIIWCDSRAVEIGNQAFIEIGEEKCLSHLLNSPGNFTASKLKWVRENEPEVYKKIHKILMPGDFIALRMTGKETTTVSGLSEGMFWDFKNEKVADFLLAHLGINPDLIPDIVDTFGDQGKLSEGSATYLGLKSGITIGYRAGDQPNNALSLNVFNPGEVAATGGTSGVVYGVLDKAVIDKKMRVNSFAHVNHTTDKPRIGVLLCVNGAGIQYSWMKQMMAEESMTYPELEEMAASVEVGSDGLIVIPFGNGAERVLENKNPGAQILNLHFNLHKKAHFYRAALEGIAFSYIYGMEVMNEMGLDVRVIKVGNDNLFQSEIFSTTIATVLNCEIQMLEATGAVGAAKAAGIGSGVYASTDEAFQTAEVVKVYQADADPDIYKSKYQNWKLELEKIINN